VGSKYLCGSGRKFKMKKIEQRSTMCKKRGYKSPEGLFKEEKNIF
jgi:hypothetical protein